MNSPGRIVRHIVAVAAGAAVALEAQGPTEPAGLESPRVEAMAPINIVPPRYPDFARANRIEGAVTLAANISPQGKITGLKPVSGNAVFVKPAMAAVSRWTYRPASVNGVPVAAATMIRVKFRLSNREERH